MAIREFTSVGVGERVANSVAALKRTIGSQSPRAVKSCSLVEPPQRPENSAAAMALATA